MEITEVRIKLMEEHGERLQAFCSITFDHCFVIRDLKIIEGGNGAFVAMPSRKLTAHCPQCGCKNHLRAGYCNQCGLRLKDDRVPKDDDGRVKLYADIAHPINSACRELIQDRVIRAFHEELERAKQPGYTPSYDDYDEEFVATPHSHVARPAAERRGAPVKLTPQSTGDSTKVEPPQPSPRGPHKLSPTSTAPQEAAPKRNDGFGSGIL